MAKTYNPNSPFYYDQMMSSESKTVRILKQDGTEVIRGIFKDEFTFGIQNQWQTGGSSILKMMVDTIGDMVTGRDAKLLGAMAKGAISGIESAFGKSEASTIATTVVDKFKNLSNSAIFSADDFFKSFKGSTVTMPSSISFSLLSDNSSYDIFNDLGSLLNISIGDFDAPSYFGGFVGVQSAPNGFKSNFLQFSPDQTIEGSVKIVYGDPKKGGYEINNMIISNVGFSFSKAKVIVGGNKYRPLMVDIQVSIEPARMLTREDIRKSIGV